MSDNNLLKEHIDTNAEDAEYYHECSICKQLFSNPGDVINHMKTHTFNKADTREKHLQNPYTIARSTHNGEMTYNCNHCAKSFASNLRLKVHIRNHTEQKRFKCDFCDKLFLYQPLLTTHIRSHTGEKPFTCHQCERSFSQTSHLNVHVKIWHSNDTQRENRYKCDFCEKSFKLNSYLTDHLRIHTGEKSFHCVICEKSFGRSTQLTRHMKTHTGLKLYTCQTCDRSFKSKGTWWAKHFLHLSPKKGCSSIKSIFSSFQISKENDCVLNHSKQVYH